LLKKDFYWTLFRSLDCLMQLMQFSEDLQVIKLALSIFTMVFIDAQISSDKHGYIEKDIPKLLYHLKFLV